MATILCVSHVAPWPAEGGNGLRLQRLLLWLQREGHTTVLVLTLPPYGGEQLATIRSNVARLEIGSIHHPLAGINSRRQRIKAALGRVIWQRRRRMTTQTGPMQELANQLCGEHVNQLVQQICRQQKFDCFLAYYPFTIQAFANLPKAIPLICDTVEVFSMPRQDSNGVPIQPVLRFGEEEERSMLAHCDIAIGIQKVESSYLQNLLPNHTILTVGVDSELPANPGLPSQAGQVIGILGSDHQANQEGLHDFLQKCWPAIKQACPAAELHLAGKLGMAFQQQWPGDLPAGVRVLGWLAELGNYYRNLGLVVNPVTRGTGLKIKTVEALAHSRPVVAYAVGLEGIDRDQDGGWLEVDSPQAMAEACIALLQDPERCDAIARRARQFATQHLSAENVYQPLRTILRD